MSGIASVPEVILISDDEESTEKNHKISSNSDTKLSFKKGSDHVAEEDVKNGKEQSIVPIKKCDDHELLHRANYQVSPVLFKMTARANDVLKTFLAACQPLMRSGNDIKILDSIRHDVQLANLHYLASDKFYDTVKFLAERVAEDSKNVFVYIKELSDELRAYRDKSPKAKKSSLNGDVTQSSAASGEEGKDTEGASSKPSKSRTATSGNETSSGGERGREGQSDGDSSKKGDALRRLERHLQKLIRAAKKLEQKDSSLDELDDVNSPYLMESRIKAQIMKVWLKICELEGRRPKTGRLTEKKLKYTGSRYPEINKSIERFINKKRIFPDYRDVLSVVSSENQTSNLCLRDSEVETIAQEAFRDVVKILKERRQKDEYSVAMSRVSDAEEEQKDPAEEDAELQTKLSENATKAEQRMTEVINSFAHKQVELKLEPQEVKEECCDLSPPPSPKPEVEEGGDSGDKGVGDEEEDESEDEADEVVIVPHHGGDGDSDDTTEGEDSAAEEEEASSEAVSQADSQTEDSRSSLPEKTRLGLKKRAAEEEVRQDAPEAATTEQKNSAKEPAPLQEKPPAADVSASSEGSHIMKTEPSEKKEETQVKPQQQTPKPQQKPEPEVIEIPSDDDDIAIPPTKKPKL